MGLLLYIGLVIVGLLVTAVGGLGVLGTFTPVEHRATVTVDFAAPRDRVWQVLTDRAAFVNWMPDVTAIEDLPPTAAGLTQFRMRQGRNSFVLVEIARQEPTLLTREIADDNHMFSGAWEHRLESTAGGTRLTITEIGKVPGAIPRAIMAYFVGFDYTMKRVYKALEKQVTR